MRSDRVVHRKRASVLLMLMIGPMVAAACSPAGYNFGRRSFDDQLAIISPHDEPGGRFDGARLSPGFGILYLNGFTPLESPHSECLGFLGEEPEHLLELEQSMVLKLVVHADAGVVLAVKNPDGTLTCWDDQSASNDNVSLEQTFSPGIYEVWVGNVSENHVISYRLVLSE